VVGEIQLRSPPCTVRHERRQFVAETASTPREAVDFRGVLEGYIRSAARSVTS
jgi:hypothetical protein